MNSNHKTNNKGPYEKDIKMVFGYLRKDRDQEPGKIIHANANTLVIIG